MTQSNAAQKFCLFCLIVVMLLAFNASATVWVGGDTAVAPVGGDGTSWGDVGNWVKGEESSWSAQDGTYALEAAPTAPVIESAAALPSASNDAFILGERTSQPYGFDLGPARLDSNFSAAPATLSGSATICNTWVGYKGYNGTLNVLSTGTLNTSQLVLGFLGDGGSLNNAGTIASIGDMWVGWGAPSGISADNSGDITVGGNLNMAMAAANSGDDGVLTNTGTLDIAGNIDMNLSAGSSWLNVYGGTVEAAGLVFDDFYQDGVDITEGVLILDGDVTGQVVWNPVTGQPDLAQSFGLAWWTTAVGFDTGDEDPTNDRWVTLMTAYDGAGTIMYDYDITTPGKTTIWAVPPEPSPTNGATAVFTTTDLVWFDSPDAISYDVYFGTSQSAVANAQRLRGDINGDGPVNVSDLSVLASQWLTNPGSTNPSADIVLSNRVDLEDFAEMASDWQQSAVSEFKGNQIAATYDPGTLTPNTTYYWRIDEVNSGTTTPGTVWSFTTEDNTANTSYSYSDTWVAVDALGRTLPDHSTCGTPRSDRYVALFYFLTFGALGPCDTPFNHDGPYDITQLLAANPYNPAYGPAPCYFPQTGAAHHWGQPEMGYYLSDDQWVIRKHAYMLANADVDVIVFDVTNYPRYTSNYMAVCNVFSQVRSEGGTTPQITFMTNWNADSQVQNLYNEFYSRNYYSDLWFYWKGKPLILGPLNGMDDPAGGTISYSSTVLNFFNFRYAWADTAGSGQDIWSWIDMYPQPYGWHDNPSTPEALTVSCGRHANYSQDGQPYPVGRSYQNGNEPSLDQYWLTGYEDQGFFFAEQWSRLDQIDPELVFITGWNEWVAGRLIIPPEGQPFSGNYPFLDGWVGPGETLFVDCYNQEFSRDIEPMKDGHTDNYYYQMIDGIRRYKGVRQLPAPSAAKTINIDGSFGDWVSVGPEYVDWLGDTMHRSSEGWGSGVTYTNTTGRNDFLGAKVARDDTYVYFYIRTDVNISSYTDNNWMMLFINSDQNYSTGWEGYDYVVNIGVTNSTTTTLKHTTSGWNWSNVNTNIAYRVSGNQMEIRVPRSNIGQGSGSDRVAFDFKWSDNIQNNNDIIEFSVSGDSAPDRRFNYRYDTNIRIANPGFEYPNISGFEQLPVGSDWNYAGGGFIIADSGSAFGNTAYQGGQNLILQQEASVWQTVSGFEIGRDYKVTWAEADRANPYGGNTLQVLIDGNVVGPLHTVTDNNWVLKTSNTFTATSTTHTLKFDATNNQSGDRSVFIDAVSITEMP